VPLSKLQGEVLLLLASHRNPESYVAGATALNPDGPRFSADIDIFHDREEGVAQASSADTGVAGRERLWHSMAAARGLVFMPPLCSGAARTQKLNGCAIAIFRFFPAVKERCVRLPIACCRSGDQQGVGGGRAA